MTIAVGQRAPEFHLPSLDGPMTALSDYRGRSVVLVFLRHLG
ncbi:MAG: redoxin domain-containing protein [Chloroflexota bacterium]